MLPLAIQGLKFQINRLIVWLVFAIEISLSGPLLIGSLNMSNPIK